MACRLTKRMERKKTVRLRLHRSRGYRSIFSGSECRCVSYQSALKKPDGRRCRHSRKVASPEEFDLPPTTLVAVRDRLGSIQRLVDGVQLFVYAYSFPSHAYRSAPHAYGSAP